MSDQVNTERHSQPSGMYLTNTMSILTLAIMMTTLLAAGVHAQISDSIPSPKKQLESGISPNDIVCSKDLVLAERNNGNVVCVKNSAAEKLNWIVIKTFDTVDKNPQADEPEPKIVIHETSSQIEPSKNTIAAPNIERTKFFVYNSIEEISDPNMTIFNVASQVPFVDDGRIVKRSIMQSSPPPQPMYHKIMNWTANNGILPDGNTIVGASIVPHEKYSIEDGEGFYLEDWMPSYIPDGQRLLFASTGYIPYDLDDGRMVDLYRAFYMYTLPTFELHENITNYDLQVTKGLHITVEYNELKQDEIEDGIEHLKENFNSQPGNYGEGFRDMNRDGKTVLAHAGGNKYNHYQAVISFTPDEYTLVSVSSNYLTLDELIPVFNSVMG